MDIGKILSVLWRGKWLVALCMAISVSAGGYYAFAVATPVFQSGAWLVLKTQNQPVVNIESVVSGVSSEEESINTELDIILSRGNLEQLVRDLELVKDPEFNHALRPEPRISFDRIKDLIRFYLGVQSQNEEQTPRSIELKTVAKVREALSVSAKPRTYLYAIVARTGDPEKSAEIVNRLAEIYLQNQIEVKIDATEFAVDWLSRRVGELELEVKAKEDAIEAIRSQTDLVSLDALEALNIRAKDLRQRLEDIEMRVATMEQAKADIARLKQSSDLADLAILLDDSILKARLADLNEGTADGRANFLARVDEVEQRYTTDITAALRQRSALQRSVEIIQAQIQEQNADLVQLNQIIRESEATKILAETFLARLKEASVQAGLMQADSRIMSDAVGGTQVAPRKSIIVVFSAMVGIMVGTAILLLRQFIQIGFRTNQELEEVTGQSVLGQIPIIPGARTKVLDYLKSKPTSAAAEAIRNFRTTILAGNADGPPKVIMMTSSIPGEGKTTLSTALAMNLAGLNKSVLLVDGDIRRRTLGLYFKPTAPGNLVSAILKEHKLEDVINKGAISGVDVILGAKSDRNPADLYSSDEFKQLVLQMREQYDFIIFDTPPVLVVPDARIVGRFVDTTFYTVHWSSTPQGQVAAGLRELKLVGLNVGGLVLSKVDRSKMRQYEYGRDYGGYGNYGKKYYDI